MKDIICIYSHFCYNSFYFHNPLSFYIFPSNFLILHNQQSTLAFSIMQQSANENLAVASLQRRKEQGGTGIKATGDRQGQTNL